MVGAVVAWVDLSEPARARTRLEELAGRPAFRGIRHLIHNESDPHWSLRPGVQAGIGLLEQRKLILELPAEFPRHLADVPELARRFPDLTIVIDHLAKPPIGAATMAVWADQLAAAAAAANVNAKVSGLNTTVARSDWSREDFEPAIRIAVDAFGPERLLWGSDWPVALLNGTYEAVWRETLAAVETVTPYDADEILGANARRLYRIHGRASMSSKEANGRATDQAIAKIKDLISSGEFTAGEKLPNERALTQRFGLSRSSLREAVGRWRLSECSRRRSETGPTSRPSSRSFYSPESGSSAICLQAHRCSNFTR